MFTVGFDDTRPRVTHNFLGQPCESLSRRKKTRYTNPRVELSRLVCAEGLPVGAPPANPVPVPIPVPDRPFPDG